MAFEKVPSTEEDRKILNDQKKEVNDGLQKNEKLFGPNGSMKDLGKKIQEENESKTSLSPNSAKAEFGKNLQKMSKYGLEEKFKSEYENSLVQKEYPEWGDKIYYPITKKIVTDYETTLIEDSIKKNKENFALETKEKSPILDTNNQLRNLDTTHEQ